LPLGPLHIDVDPLVIAGQLGETVDHVLGHGDGLAPFPEGVADLRLQPLDVVEANIVHVEVLLANRWCPGLPTPAGAPNGRPRGAGAGHRSRLASRRRWTSFCICPAWCGCTGGCCATGGCPCGRSSCWSAPSATWSCPSTSCRTSCRSSGRSTTS